MPDDYKSPSPQLRINHERISSKVPLRSIWDRYLDGRSGGQPIGMQDHPISSWNSGVHGVYQPTVMSLNNGPSEWWMSFSKGICHIQLWNSKLYFHRDEIDDRSWTKTKIIFDFPENNVYTTMPFSSNCYMHFILRFLISIHGWY